MRLNLLINIVFCLLSIGLYAQEDFKSESELKEKAEELFDKGQLIEATPLFAQLLSLYPKDPIYNYKYGACLLESDPDKEKPLKYLQFATTASGSENLSHYYLGKAYHLNYDFAKAVKQYSRFKNKASSSEKEKFDVERQIEMCKNGNDLLSKLNEVQVLDKQSISKKDFFRIYDLKGIDGKIIAKPEDFMSKYDKKNGEKSLIYLPSNAKEVYYSSYGAKGEAGKDLFKVIKLGNGNWSDPVNLGASINTPFDEEFAFIHPDGRTLYFASKGHTSMGGYDLFVSTFDNSANDWTEPINLDFAFSSVDDDVLFVTDENKEFAFFASSRSNSSDKYTVYKVKVERTPADISLIKGSFIAENNVTLKKAKITVIDHETKKTIGVYETDANGNYLVEIAKNGGTYEFNIETTEDAPIHSGLVTIPKQSEFEVLGQELRLVGEGDEQILVIKNIFDGTASSALSSSGPKISSELLRKKASLEVNLSPDEIIALENNTNNTNLSSEELASNEIINNTSNSDNSNNEASNTDNQTEVINRAGNNTSAENASSEQMSSVLDKKALEVKLGLQKDLISNDLTEYEKALNLSYSETELYVSESNRLFNKVEEQKSSGAPEETIAFTEQEAKRNALLAAYSLNSINKIENRKKELLNQNVLIEQAESKIDEGDLSSTSRLINEIETKTKQNISLEKFIAEIKTSSQETALLNASKIESLSKKQESFKNEISEIELKLADLEKNKKSYKEDEYDQKNKGLSLDKEDLNYQNSIIEKQKIVAFNDEEAIQVKLEQIETLEGKWLDGKEKGTVYSQYTEENFDEIKAQVDGYISNDQLSFNQSGEEIDISSESEISSNNQLENSNLSDETISINQLYEDKLNIANQTADLDLQNAEKIKILTDWTSDLEYILNSKKENLVAESNENSKEEIIAEIDQIEIKLNAVNNSKLEIEQLLIGTNSTAIAELSNGNANVNSGNRSTNSPQNVNSSPYTSFELVNDYSYNNQGAESTIIAAKQAFVEAEGFGKKSKEVRSAAYDLPSVEERNKAFEKASAYERAGRIKQIEVAENYGLINAAEFNRNKSLIDNSDNYGEDFQSTNLDIAKLLSEEAELYYNKARDLREALVDADRISKKEAELQKAYDFEILSLRKQDEALSILKIVDTEFVVNPTNELDGVGYSNDIFSEIENSDEFAADQAIIEIEKGDKLMKEALQLEDRRIGLQASLESETDENVRLNIMAQIEELIIEEERLTAEATSFYQEANKLNGLSGVINSSPAYAAVNKPARVENLTTIDLETIEITDQRGDEIKSKQAYVDFIGLANQRNQALKAAENEYVKATKLTDEKRRLSKEARILKSTIAAEEDEETKQRLIKTAEIIDFNIIKLETELDSINLIISDQNQIIEAANTKMAIVLDSLSETERNEILKVANSELNGVPLNAQEAIADNSSSSSIDGANNVTSNETSQGSDNLPNLDGSGNEVLTEGNEDNGLVGNEFDNTGSSNQSGNTTSGNSNTNGNENVSGSNESAGTNNNYSESSNTNDIKPFETVTLNEIDNSINSIPRIVRQAIFVKIASNKSAYNVSNPIPVNPKMPEGLVYKVQIGAFRNPIPQDLFKGFAPLMAEKIPSGITRYTAGIFVNEREAITARNEIRSFGYPDAFVVAFMNGKRIGVSQARKTDKSAAQLSNNSGSSSSRTNKTSNIPQTATGSKVNLPSKFNSPKVAEVVNSSTISGVYFTVQVGVFSKPLAKGKYVNYQPMNVCVLPSGLIRYNSGVFKTAGEANSLKNTINQSIKDAFIVAYYNGKRISLGEAARILNQ